MIRDLRHTVLAGTLAICLGSASAQEAHILNGGDWLRLDHSHKVMFVSGISQILEMERHLVSGDYTRDSASFIPQLVRGLQGMTIGEIIERVDTYYRDHADGRENTVVDAIFRSIIYPKVEGTFPSNTPLDTAGQPPASTKLDQ